jgi:hypothetical protein
MFFFEVETENQMVEVRKRPVVSRKKKPAAEQKQSKIFS